MCTAGLREALTVPGKPLYLALESRNTVVKIIRPDLHCNSFLMAYMRAWIIAEAGKSCHLSGYSSSSAAAPLSRPCQRCSS